MIGLVSPLKTLVTTISLSGVVAGGYGVSYLFKDKKEKLIPEEKRKVGPTETRKYIGPKVNTREREEVGVAHSILSAIKKDKEFFAEEIYREESGKTICKNLTLVGGSVSFENVVEEECQQKIQSIWGSNHNSQPKLWIKAKEEDAINKALSQYSISLGRSAVINSGWTCEKTVTQEESEKRIIVGCNKESKEQDSEEQIL